MTIPKKYQGLEVRRLDVKHTMDGWDCIYIDTTMPGLWLTIERESRIQDSSWQVKPRSRSITEGCAEAVMEALKRYVVGIVRMQNRPLKPRKSRKK